MAELHHKHTGNSADGEDARSRGKRYSANADLRNQQEVIPD